MGSIRLIFGGTIVALIVWMIVQAVVMRYRWRPGLRDNCRLMGMQERRRLRT